MKPFFRVRPFKRSLKSSMEIIFMILVFLYVLLPLMYRFWPGFQRHLIFLTFINKKPGVDYENPAAEGLKGTRNIYLESEPGVKVGVWHVLPKSLISKTFEEPEDSLADGLPIVVYLHGNSGSRASPHRVELYTILQELDYHVITADYRGYADSTKSVTISEDGVVKDAMCVYNYVKKHSASSMVVVWGHSLGTGVASRTVSELCISDMCPDRLVLESPFNNIRDEIRMHPLSTLHRFFPAFDWFFTDPLVSNNLAFDSDVHIANINCPILILHAQDDKVVPLVLGKKLYEAALNKRATHWPHPQFIEFHGSFEYGHKFICQAPELPSIIQEYFDITYSGLRREDSQRLIQQ